MEEWQIFENECANYLQKEYSDRGVNFIVAGGYDANKSDIQVIKNNKQIFSIECKMSVAQCGQFVLFIDELNKNFIFSKKNKAPYDDYVKSVIVEMEQNFDKCKVSTKDLPISQKVICEWVKNYYLNVKKSSYCITRSNLGFIVLPIENIDNYFDFSAKYRIKKSGSTNPTKNNKEEIKEILHQINVISDVEMTNSGCFAKFAYNKDKFILCGNKYRYQFTKDGAKYKIRRLSNTNNANFIVSIKLKEATQKYVDLARFESELIK